MKLLNYSLLLTLLCLASIVSGPARAAEQGPIGDFTLLDHQGKSHQLSWYGDHKAFVIFAHANGSETCLLYTSPSPRDS